ncbi:MAG TPA: hypothetical protein VF376_05065, partial [Thermoanaerobaculia bacterium]
MIGANEGASAPGVERFSVSATRDRWREFLFLEHATLPPPTRFAREGDEWVVERPTVPGRRIAAGRIPGEQAPALFLQAASLCAFLQAFGFWLDEEDLSSAVYDRAEGTARLWVLRTPAGIHRGGPGPAPSAVLGAFLHRLFARGRRVGLASARSLFDQLTAPDAAFRRAEYWVAGAFRAFPQLAASGAAPARARMLGFAGSFYRGQLRRAILESAVEQLNDRFVRVFSGSGSRLDPGGALGLPEAPGSTSAAARALRVRHTREDSKQPSVWIAVNPDRWDDLSRRAFDAATRALAGKVEARVLAGEAPVPRLPDEWRREIFVPCGTLGASLRFYEELAALARSDPRAGLDLVRGALASDQWGAFVADPTGNGPLPLPRSIPESGVARSADAATPVDEVLEFLAAFDAPIGGPGLARLFPRRPLSRILSSLESRGWATRVADGWRLAESARRRLPLSQPRRRAHCRRRASIEENPARRVELLLEAGDIDEALEAAEKWFRVSGARPPEQWFALSALLASSCRGELPPWLGMLEAERELAGGRADEAERRFSAIAACDRATPDERRACALRVAEVEAHRGEPVRAGKLAAEWRRTHPDASPRERVRAARLEVASLSRSGNHDGALRLLEVAESEGAAEDLEFRLETALARAGVYSAAGRFADEKEVYDQWRPAVLEAGNDLLTARLLSREALGLSDRRDFPLAVARLEQALAVAQDDSLFRAQLLMDLAATLYHAGRGAACHALLDEAIELSSGLGRQDLLRGARANRLELWINEGRWEEASREIETMLHTAAGQDDEIWRIVALHQRSRMALRRGFLEDAARDNAEARSIIARVGDRLEIGELWLEEGDRLLYTGDVEAARRAYEAAAADPPDRCDSDQRARNRLEEIVTAERGDSRAMAEDLGNRFSTDEYGTAEAMARAHVLRDGHCDDKEPL